VHHGAVDQLTGGATVAAGGAVDGPGGVLSQPVSQLLSCGKRLIGCGCAAFASGKRPGVSVGFEKMLFVGVGKAPSSSSFA